MRYILMTAACALSMHSAVAQELKSIEVVFEVTRGADGSLIFAEKNPNEDVKVFSYDENFVATLEKMKGPPTTGWAVSDASGRVKDVLLAGTNQSVPPELLAQIGVGESVTKVNIASIGGVSFPTEDEIDELFRQSVATIIDRMCVLPSNRRPADMTTSWKPARTCLTDRHRCRLASSACVRPRIAAIRGGFGLFRAVPDGLTPWLLGARGRPAGPCCRRCWRASVSPRPGRGLWSG